MLRNSKGDDPILQDLRGYGWLFNMVSKDCKYPDRVMKLFDYLTSPEGQLLVRYGVEGESWTWADQEKTHIKYTEEYIQDFKNSDNGRPLRGKIHRYEPYTERIHPNGIYRFVCS